MITIRQSVETFFFIIFATAITLFVMVQRGNNRNQPLFSAALPNSSVPIPTDTPPEPSVSTMDSPEGSKTITLEGQENKETIAYSLYISSKSDVQKQNIFKKEEANSQILEIPFNAWSPNNVYIFLKEKASSSNDYLVFQSSGNPFSNEVAYLSIQELFKKKIPNYVIEDVTGWADSNLLIVNTKSIEGDNKVSFWFDVPSQSFIQLGTYFK